MSESILGLIIFAALSAGAAAAVMAARDLLFARRRAAPESATVRLRRLPRLPQDEPRGAVASFDRWFLQMVRETGTGWSAIEATLLLVLCGTVVGGCLFVMSDHPLLAALGMFGGMGAALAYLAYRRRKRVQQLQSQLPGALDMLARSMRAGRSVDEAVQMVGRQLPEPLAAEFRFCANQLGLGLSLPAVMRSLVERVRLFDVRIFTTTLTVHRQTGGNLALVLERLAAVIRERINYRRQLRSMTGAGRFSAMLIAAIGPLLFFYFFLFHPNYVKAMLDSSLGQAMLIAAFTLETIGLIWTARLLKPTY